MCVCVCVCVCVDCVLLYYKNQHNSPLTPSKSDPRCSWWMNPLVAIATQPAFGERQAARGEGGEEEEHGAGD